MSQRTDRQTPAILFRGVHRGEPSKTLSYNSVSNVAGHVRSARRVSYSVVECGGSRHQRSSTRLMRAATRPRACPGAEWRELQPQIAFVTHRFRSASTLLPAPSNNRRDRRRCLAACGAISTIPLPPSTKDNDRAPIAWKRRHFYVRNCAVGLREAFTPCAPIRATPLLDAGNTPAPRSCQARLCGRAFERSTECGSAPGSTCRAASARRRILRAAHRESARAAGR